MKPEPRARRSVPPSAAVAVVTLAALAAEEAVEEVLHVALLVVVIAVLGGPALPRRLRVLADCLGISSVLMLTTAGPTCLTIWEKPLERVTGEGMTRGWASEVSTLACSLPLTLRVRTEPTRMPIESVARSVKVVVRR